ncbi:MAG TPA: RNA methyltransferase [Ktedonobacterales bacterium]
MNPRTVKVYTENNLYQYIDTLRRRREKRQREGVLFLEGVRPISLALAHGWRVTTFVYAPERRLSTWARDILAQSQAETHVELPAALLAQLSNKNEPSELLALVAMPADDLDRIAVSPDLLVVVFDRPASPGNLGSIIRSCDALGAHGLIMTGHSVDLYDPETISASVGSLFALPVVRLPSPTALVPWREAVRQRFGALQMVGCDETGDAVLSAHDFRGPTLLVMGNEKWGMSAAYREQCDVIARIPMAGSASSLNVASATSIFLYEIARQRGWQTAFPHGQEAGE